VVRTCANRGFLVEDGMIAGETKNRTGAGRDAGRLPSRSRGSNLVQRLQSRAANEQTSWALVRKCMPPTESPIRRARQSRAGIACPAWTRAVMCVVVIVSHDAETARTARMADHWLVKYIQRPRQTAERTCEPSSTALQTYTPGAVDAPRGK